MAHNNVSPSPSVQIANKMGLKKIVLLELATITQLTYDCS
jgi:hypothetical protein